MSRDAARSVIREGQLIEAARVSRAGATAGLSLSMVQRVAAFRRAFPHRPASWPWLVEEQGHPAIYAVWVIGADYRNPTRFFGAYPHGYLDRVMALFLDVTEAYRTTGEIRTLHVFSGSVPRGPYLRLDLKARRYRPEYLGSVYDAPTILAGQVFSLVLADPPYTATDSQVYGTPMVNRRLALAALAQVTAPGGILAWLDVCWPMFRKDQWTTVGRIYIRRATNHRVRELTLFQRLTS